MTIKDIAKACGVSVSTVSRVLNDHPDVSREREGPGALHRGAPGLHTQQQRQRPGALPVGQHRRGGSEARDNLFFSAMVKTISREIERRGYTMVLHFIGSDDDEVMAGAILEREKKLREASSSWAADFDYSSGDPLPGGRALRLLHLHPTASGSLDERDYSSVSIDDYDDRLPGGADPHQSWATGASPWWPPPPTTAPSASCATRATGRRWSRTGLEFEPASCWRRRRAALRCPRTYRGMA